jgi:hypothetical protein
MLLKGKRSSRSNVVTLQQCCYPTACKKGRGVLTAMFLPNSNVAKREEKF